MKATITCCIELDNHPTFNTDDKDLNYHNIWDLFRGSFLIKHMWIQDSMVKEHKYLKENNIEMAKLEKSRQSQYNEDIKFMEEFCKNLRIEFDKKNYD